VSAFAIVLIVPSSRAPKVLFVEYDHMVGTTQRSQAAAIRRVLPLAHDPLEPELAGVLEHGRAVAFDVIVKPNAGQLWPGCWPALPCGPQADRGGDRSPAYRNTLASWRRYPMRSKLGKALDQLYGVDKVVGRALIKREMEVHRWQKRRD
jgi:hypothetical protein